MKELPVDTVQRCVEVRLRVVAVDAQEVVVLELRPLEVGSGCDRQATVVVDR